MTTKNIDYATLYTRVRDLLQRDIYFTVGVETRRHTAGEEGTTKWVVYVAWRKGEGEFYYGDTALAAFEAFTHGTKYAESLDVTSALVGTGEVSA